MGTKWNSTKFPGVRYREHEIRKHGIRKDQYFAIRYQKDGTRQEEGLGWLSEGWSAQKAFERLAELKRKGTTLTEEREAERQAKAESEREAEKVRLAAMTFTEFWHQQYFPQAEHDKATKTAKTEEQFFRLWISPEIGEKTFSNIAPIDLERLKRTMAGKGKSPRTIHYALAIIRQVFNLARVRGVFLGPTPVKDVKKPTEDNRRMRFLSHEEAERLLAALAE